MSKMKQRRPLSGIRVIDFGQYIAGPAAAMMMADMGAEVIRVEKPGGPLWQDPATSVLNRRTVDLVAPNAIRSVEASINIPGHAPEYGAHTREILTGLKFSTQQIDAWMRAGDISECWSKDYLPV